MTREARRRKWRWLRHVVWVLAAKVLLILLILAGVAIFFGSGAGNPLIHGFVVKRLEKMTGGQVTLQSISIRWLSLEVRLKGLVLHGREPAGTEPLFAADEVQAGLRIDSFWGHKVSKAPDTHTHREKRIKQYSSAAKRDGEEAGARNIVRSAYPAFATAEWLGPL
jgi:hypothetical protein